jgi:hypothetical protein
MDKERERKKDTTQLDPNCDIGCVCLICASWSCVWSNSKTLGGALRAQIAHMDICRLGKKAGKVESFVGPTVLYH